MFSPRWVSRILNLRILNFEQLQKNIKRNIFLLFADSKFCLFHYWLLPFLAYSIFGSFYFLLIPILVHFIFRSLHFWHIPFCLNPNSAHSFCCWFQILLIPFLAHSIFGLFHFWLILLLAHSKSYLILNLLIQLFFKNKQIQ